MFRLDADARLREEEQTLTRTKFVQESRAVAPGKVVVKDYRETIQFCGFEAAEAERFDEAALDRLFEDEIATEKVESRTKGSSIPPVSASLWKNIRRSLSSEEPSAARGFTVSTAGLPPAVDKPSSVARARELALKVLHDAEAARDRAAQREADRALDLEGPM